MESFVAQRPQLLEYDRHRQIFESNLGPVTVIQYEDALDRGGTVSEFFRVLGCDVPPNLSELWEREDGQLPSFEKAAQP
jgi:hypothetical protein